MNYYESPRTFKATYKCYSVSMLFGNERADVERGGKIIMPPSALDQLTRLSVVYPMLFRLTNTEINKITHCGVLEFVADEGKVYLPYWMMRNLLLTEGSMIQVENATLPVATFSKFQPQSVDFLDITNPKAVLENALRNYACLTTGDVIAINYNDKVYEVCVLETQPSQAVTIIECDMRVDFAPPVGYQEPQKKPKEDDTQMDCTVDQNENQKLDNKFRAFVGQGNRLDGKTKNTIAPKELIRSKSPVKRGIPDYDYKIGYLNFFRFNSKRKELEQQQKESEEDSKFVAFGGSGSSLREKNKKKEIKN